MIKTKKLPHKHNLMVSLFTVYADTKNQVFITMHNLHYKQLNTQYLFRFVFLPFLNDFKDIDFTVKYK